MVPIEVLKTSLFGYQKRGVEQYISRMRDEFNDRIVQDEMEHEKKVSGLQQQLDSSLQENQAAQERQKQLEVQNADYCRQMEELQRELSALRQREDQRRRLEDKVADLEQDKQALTAQAEKMKVQCAQAEEYRATLEKLQLQISRVLEQEELPTGPRTRWTAL